MNKQFSIELLRERINDFEHNEGFLPKVRFSMAFFEEHPHEIAKLSKEGIHIKVVDEITDRHSFLLEKVTEKSPKIDILLDIKKTS